jgi:hypothetical protein
MQELLGMDRANAARRLWQGALLPSGLWHSSQDDDDQPKPHAELSESRDRRGHQMQSVTVATFRDDPLFPKISRAVEMILAKDKVVRPIDVLVGMHLLSRDDLDAWRFSRVPYLEKVIDCNLTRLSRLLRILRFHVHDLNLVPSVTAYMRHGRGPKRQLRFTKTGDARLEKAYATHFIWPGKGPWHPTAVKSSGAETIANRQPRCQDISRSKTRRDHRANAGEAPDRQALGTPSSTGSLPGSPRQSFAKRDGCAGQARA